LHHHLLHFALESVLPPARKTGTQPRSCEDKMSIESVRDNVKQCLEKALIMGFIRLAAAQPRSLREGGPAINNGWM
jgi:hypothetical protein